MTDRAQDGFKAAAPTFNTWNTAEMGYLFPPYFQTSAAVVLKGLMSYSKPTWHRSIAGSQAPPPSRWRDTMEYRSGDPPSGGNNVGFDPLVLLWTRSPNRALMGSLPFKIWPFLNPCWMTAPVWQVLCHLLLSLNFVFRMGKKGISNHGLFLQFGWTGNSSSRAQGGGDEIRSLTEATVTAATKGWKLSSPSPSKKVSGVHCTVGFFFTFSIMVRLKGDKVRRWKHQLQNI